MSGKTEQEIFLKLFLAGSRSDGAGVRVPGLVYEKPIEFGNWTESRKVVAGRV